MKRLMCGSIMLRLVSMFTGVAPQPQSQLDVEEVAVLIPNSTPEQANTIAATHGFDNMGQIGSLQDYYLFKHKNTDGAERREAIATLREDQQVAWLEPQTLLKRVKRQIDVNYRLYSYILHTDHRRTSMKIKEAWNAGYSGLNVVVTVIDDGVYGQHPDLRQNFDSVASYDFNDNDPDPTPKDGENMHGTRSALEIAGHKGNNSCALGVAYEARIGGIKMLDGDVTDALESKSLSFRPQHVDIYVASWGPPNDGKLCEGPGALAQTAFLSGVQQGRQGRGNIYVWAAGNGGNNDDSCACDGYTTSIYTISVNSITFDNYNSSYNEICPSILTSTYSSGIVQELAENSTDFPNGCKNKHSGTSAPMAAGIIAMALEANPRLTWRDVQHLIVRTSDPGDMLSIPGWVTNGAGRQVSSVFGYGVLNAEGMVNMARNWRNVPPQVTCKVATIVPASARGLNRNFNRTFEIFFDGCPDVEGGPLNYVEHVELYVNLQYRERGDLQIILTSPEGTRSVMLPPRRRDFGGGTLLQKWPFMSVQQWGERPQGRWLLSFINIGSPSNSGIIRSYSLVLYGTRDPPQPVQ